MNKKKEGGAHLTNPSLLVTLPLLLPPSLSSLLTLHTGMNFKALKIH
jgi:hypothetical protein